MTPIKPKSLTIKTVIALSVLATSLMVLASCGNNKNADAILGNRHAALVILLSQNTFNTTDQTQLPATPYTKFNSR